MRMGDVDDGQPVEAEDDRTIGVRIHPGARLVGPAVAHRMRRARDRVIGPGGGRVINQALRGSDERQQTTHGAPVCRTSGECVDAAPGTSRMADKTGGPGFRRRAQARGLRCVVFDIRAGGANVTPREQDRSQRLSQGSFRRRSGGRGKGLSRRLRPFALALTLGVLALFLSGCSGWADALALGWPRGITPEAHLNRELWIGAVIASLVVGGIVFGLIFWASAFHRHKKGDTELPRQFGYNMPLELALTVTPFLIISVLFYFTVVVQERMLHKDPNPEVVVDITAFQWNWKFGYQKINFGDGTFSYDGVDNARKEAMTSKPGGTYENGEERVGAIRGLNPEDRTYLSFVKVETLGSSVEIRVLVVPAGKRIEFQVASADVMHGCWVPEFLLKRDVLPDPKANNSD